MKAGLSIRRRLTIASAVLLIAALTLGGYGLNLIFERHIERRFAAELNDRLLEVAGGFTLDAAGKPVLASLPLDPRYNQPYSGVYWYVRRADEFVLRSRSLWDATIVLPPQASAGEDVVLRAIGPGNSSLMAQERQIAFGTGAAEQRFQLGVAIDRADLQRLSSAFSADVALGLVLLGLVLFVAALFQTDYGLRPLRSLRSQLTALHTGSADKLEGPFPEEVSGLTNDLNLLFEQQKQSLQKARERAGTLAHALKTPLTILNGEARKLETAGLTNAAGAIREQIDLIRGQVDRELARARLSSAAPGANGATDAVELSRRLIELVRRMPRGTDLAWTLHAPELCLIRMDANDLGEVIGNLLDNARKWARTKVALAITESTEEVTLAVSDDGPGIPEAYRTKALARGESSAASGDDSGLGLAIVADILSAYGSKPVIGDSPDGGARLAFTIAKR